MMTAGPLRVHYEIETMRGGRWWIASLAGDPAHAVDEARLLLQAAEVGGVRVVREMTNVETGRVAALTIFESLKPPRPARRTPFASRRAPFDPGPAESAPSHAVRALTAAVPRSAVNRAGDGSLDWIPWAASVGAVLALSSAVALFMR